MSLFQDFKEKSREFWVKPTYIQHFFDNITDYEQFKGIKQRRVREMQGGNI